jgi:hypothetical protein
MVVNCLSGFEARIKTKDWMKTHLSGVIDSIFQRRNWPLLAALTEKRRLHRHLRGVYPPQAIRNQPEPV